MIKNGRTLLPLRAFGDACGVETVWDNTYRDVKIDTPAENSLVKPLIPAGLPLDIANMLAKYYIQNDTSDPLVGNWETETTVESWNGNDIVSQTKYLFIHKENGKYHAIQIGVEQTSFYTNTGFSIQKLTGLGSVSTFLFTPDDDPLTLYQDESLVYYRIPGNGISSLVAHGANQFKREGNDLVRTAESQGIVGWQTVNERYTRF